MSFEAFAYAEAGLAVPYLLAIVGVAGGWLPANLKRLKVAKYCAYAACTIFAGVSVFWGSGTDMSWGMRSLIVGVMCAIAGIIAVQTSRFLTHANTVSGMTSKDRESGPAGPTVSGTGNAVSTGSGTAIGTYIGTQINNPVVRDANGIFQGDRTVGSVDGQVSVDVASGSIDFEALRFSAYPDLSAPLEYRNYLFHCDDAPRRKPNEFVGTLSALIVGARCKIVGDVRN